MRRLRVQLNGVSTPEERRRVYDLAYFAAGEAERQHLSACADSLRNVLASVKAGDFTNADAWVMQAQAAFNGPR